MSHMMSRDQSKTDMLFQKAFAAHNAGELPEAEKLYRKALRNAPSDMETLYLLGTLYSQQGKPLEASKYLKKALEIDPNHPEALNNMGLTMMALRKREEAAAYYRRALKQKPDYADAYSNLGHTLEVLFKFDEAEETLLQALRLNPNHANAHYNLGLVYLRTDRFEEAVQCFLRGLELNPGLAAAHNDLGTIYKTWGRLEKALECFERSIQLNPDAFYVRNNRGAVLEEMGRLEEAIVEYERAISLDPSDHRARWNTAYLYLRQGILDRGWEAHEARTKIDGTNDRLPYPLWDGSAIEDKTILIMAEQGLGDEIFFASCFQDVIAKAKHVVIECAKRLEPLFARSFPTATVQGASRLNVGWIVDVPKIDVQIAAGSIPRFVRPTLESFPKTPAYLYADSQRIAYWKSRLAVLGSGLKVGICWRSGLKGGERHKQYSELLQWKHIFNVPGVHFVKLQYDECEEELLEAEKAFGLSIERFSELDMKNELDETSALISALDLVITAGTAVSEMAGALGVETFRLDVHGKSMDALGTDGSPWHPRMRLFGQISPGDWETPLALVGEALKERARGAAQPAEYVDIAPDVEIAVNGSLHDVQTYVLKEQGGWFDPEYRFALDLARADMRIVDIGAGIGAYAVPMARRLASGRLWAFTHTSNETELLVKSRAKNRLEKQLNILIADQDFCLDDEMNKHGFDDIDFVRVSAGAFTQKLLERGKRFFSANSPLVMFGASVEAEAIERLAAHGYGLYRLVTGLDLLVPYTSPDELDVFSTNLFACKQERAAALERLGKLIRRTGAPENMPGIEQRYWQHYLKAMPYAEDLLDDWTNGPQRAKDWEVYWMALNLYAMAKDVDRGGAERYACLQTAAAVLSTLVQSQANLPRVLSLCRILIDLGKREVAVDLLNQICTLLHSGMSKTVEEPCLALSSAYEQIKPGKKAPDWIVAQVLLQRELLRAFSTYFTGQESLPVLEEIQALGFGCADTERRIALIQARFADLRHSE